MRKSRPGEAKRYHTCQRVSFLKHHQRTTTCTAKEFRSFVGELHRLERIIDSVKQPRPMDIYDQMLHLSKRKAASKSMDELLQISVPSLDPTPDQQAQDFVGQHFETAEADESKRRAVAIPPRTKASIDTADYGSYTPPKFLMDSADPRREMCQEKERSTNVESHPSGDDRVTVVQPTTPEKSDDLPWPKHYHHVSNKSPVLLKNLTVWRGGPGGHDKPHKGAMEDRNELFSNMTLVVDLFRGKSRLKIDMLMKEFILHARMGNDEGEKEQAHIKLKPQGFRNFMRSKEIRDPGLVDRLFKAVDCDRNGEVSFAEFRRAVQRLRGSLEQRLDMYVRIFDQSDSGALNHSEVGMLIGMGMPSATEEEVAEYADFLFEKMDEDGSGTLTSDEIINGIAQNPKLRDSLERSIV